MEGIHKHLLRLRNYGIIRPIQSPWNTPLLPVPKPGPEPGITDLRAINETIVTIHPTVPNPYVLLGLIPQTATCFTVLDSKDAFLSIKLAPQSQPLFAFQWEDPNTGRKTQHCWTRLPQGFKNLPSAFGTALGSDLQGFPTVPQKRVLLQYVDDLLLACDTPKECWNATKELLQLLCDKGYKVSKKKAQLCKGQVKYLGYHISHGIKTLEQGRREAVCALPEPKTENYSEAS